MEVDCADLDLHPVMREATRRNHTRSDHRCTSTTTQRPALHHHAYQELYTRMPTSCCRAALSAHQSPREARARGSPGAASLSSSVYPAVSGTTHTHRCSHIERKTHRVATTTCMQRRAFERPAEARTRERRVAHRQPTEGPILMCGTDFLLQVQRAEILKRHLQVSTICS